MALAPPGRSPEATLPRPRPVAYRYEDLVPAGRAPKPGAETPLPSELPRTPAAEVRSSPVQTAYPSGGHNTCGRYYSFLMYDRLRDPCVYIRKLPCIGPGPCE